MRICNSLPTTAVEGSALVRCYPGPIKAQINTMHIVLTLFLCTGIWTFCGVALFLSCRTQSCLGFWSFFERTKIWAPSSEFVSSSIPSWQILTAHAQPFRGGRDLAFCLKVPLDSLLVWASSEGSGETARMRRLAWTFAARIGDKYQIRLTRSKWWYPIFSIW